jgi:exopolysaccharide biosynthesis protein
MKSIFIVAVALVLPVVAENGWHQAGDGMSYAYFPSSIKSIAGTSTIVIVRVDPSKYRLKLLSAKEQHHAPLTAAEWAERYRLIVTVNAGMFAEDHLTNVGFMKNFGSVNNGHVNGYLSAVAFNPKKGAADFFHMYDLDHLSIDSVLSRYNTVIQNLRLIKYPGVNVWANQSRKWSECALGQDKNGNLIIAFSRSPYSMHDFNTIVLALPIDIQYLQHLEGGPEASLRIACKGSEINLSGSYETDFNESDDSKQFYPLPNVIGVAAIK